jgi:thiamine-monophosphate kinase
MGAGPGEAYVALAVPPDFGEEDCLRLLDGMVEVAAETGTTIAGGDVTRASALGLAVTVVGHAERPEQLIGRGGAREGDALVLTGEIGAAAAGLLPLERPAPEGLPAGLLAELRSRQLDPTPRLEAGRALARCGATAMIDLSDGLGGDAAHIAESSGVGLRIAAERLPLAEGVAQVAEALGRDVLELAVGGGEDYELLAALPQEAVAGAAGRLARIGLSLTAIGEVRGRGVEIRRPDGAALPARGFDQLT